jgi:hypothetical protein
MEFIDLILYKTEESNLGPHACWANVLPLSYIPSPEFINLIYIPHHPKTSSNQKTKDLSMISWEIR